MDLLINLDPKEESEVTHLFTLEVIQVSLAKWFKMPHIPFHDRTTDLEDYLMRSTIHI